MRYKRFLVLFLAALLLLCCGCEAQPSGSGRTGIVKGSRSGHAVQADTDKAAAKAAENEETGSGSKQELAEDLYRILSIQTKDNVIRFENLKSGKSQQYAYSGATNILDKNGKATTVDSLYSGLVVQIGVSKKTDKLTDVTVSDSKWIHTDITNFEVDAGREVLTVGQTDYAMEDDLKIFSGNEEIFLSELSDEDTLTLVGEDKDILSIIVSNGHGTIKLANTDLFVGGWLTVGKRVSQEITKDMELEIAEGTYTLAAASPDGYGDSTEITVSNGEVTQVDLNELKGEGPKTCRIIFTVNAENPRLYLNGDRADLTNPIDLKYGIYSLKVEADGYETWNKKLMVSSASAAINIELTANSDAVQSASGVSGTDAASADTGTASGASGNTSGTNNQAANKPAKAGQAGSMAGSLTGGGSTNSNSSGNNTSGYTTSGSGTVLNNDTLSTISSLIDILTNKSGSSTNNNNSNSNTNSNNTSNNNNNTNNNNNNNNGNNN
ncbi:MAG: hypothetical protein HFG80_08070 [Eubacterium sp.]|nr:hypothetical protein [Eubacterium sp.]